MRKPAYCLFSFLMSVTGCRSYPILHWACNFPLQNLGLQSCIGLVNHCSQVTVPVRGTDGIVIGLEIMQSLALHRERALLDITISIMLSSMQLHVHLWLLCMKREPCCLEWSSALQMSSLPNFLGGLCILCCIKPAVSNGRLRCRRARACTPGQILPKVG